MVYIASGFNIQFYDGVTWSAWGGIPFPTESAGVRKFAVTSDGTVYAAGAGVMGFVRTAGATREFVSLAGRLPPTALGADDVYDVLAVGKTVHFADEQKISIWRDGRFHVVPSPSPPHSQGARLHRIGDKVYVTTLGHPLRLLVGDRFEVVADDPVLRQNQIISVEPGPAGTLVLLTAARGFFQLAAGRVAPLPLDANRWLAGKTILRAQRLADGSLAVAFTSVSGDGGMRFDSAGRYVGPIDNSIGLYVKTLRGFFCDREGGLWIGSETGVFRLEWPSPVTVFDGVNGLGQGAVADAIRHEGTLYAATTEGVFRLRASDDRDGRGARFERVFHQPAYSLASHPAGLLIAGYNAVSVQTPSGFNAIATVPPGGAILQRSKRDPDRVWITTSASTQAIRHTASGWHADTGAPNPDESTASAGPVENILRRLPQLVKATAGPVTRIREEKTSEGEVLWICGANSLVRVDLARSPAPPVPFATQLQPVNVRAGDELARSHPPLAFSFIAPRHQIPDSVTYQTRLAGLEHAWSAWSPTRERVFTNLPPGAYRFEVRARDADGRRAAPAALAFSVLPPWWRTAWAVVGYALGAGVAVAGIVGLRTRALRRRAGQLEAVIAHRTSELAEQNLELTRLHRLEFDEKVSARLAEEKSRLEVLRYQLNPHFLFNTLASISSALPSAQSTARTMVERLATFCRLTLHRTDDREWTTLGEEMQLLRVYLEIEQSRWGDLLDVAIDCPASLQAERVPHFLLLPLVENALKYGRATSPDRVGLRLAARRDSPGAALVLEVSNTGTWIEPTQKKTVSSLGIGLDNLRERLVRYYPGSHDLVLSHARGWVTVELRLTRIAPSLPEPGRARAGIR